MTRNFVAIGDPVHQLLRNLSRRSLLQPFEQPDGRIVVRYSLEGTELPDDYYSLATLHGIAGMSLQQARRTHFQLANAERKEIPMQVNFFEALTLDRRCSRDLRLKVSSDPASMTSAEILSFGTGTLRARNDDPTEPFFRFLWAHHGRIHTEKEVVHARIFGLHRLSRPGPHDKGKESFDSTNVLYGDVYGELEQLWERRADTAFLDQVAQSLTLFRKRGALGTVVHPSLDPVGIHRLHLQRQGVWKSPPATARALLRRLEFILDHTTVDKSAETRFSLSQPQQISRQQQSNPRSSLGYDASGYDGWFSEDGLAS